MAPGDSQENFFSKRLFLICVILIVTGVLLNLFKMPSENLLVTKLSNVDETKCIKMGEELAFSHKDLNLNRLNRKHKRNRTDIRDNTVVLFYDGYIKTPFIKFEEGYYVINFDARGSKAWEEFSILKIEFERLDPNHYLIAKKSKYIQLTRKVKPWSMEFWVEAPIIGRVKVSFVNDDLEPGGKRDRNAWVKNIKIRKGNS